MTNISRMPEQARDKPSKQSTRIAQWCVMLELGEMTTFPFSSSKTANMIQKKKQQIQAKAASDQHYGTFVLANNNPGSIFLPWCAFVVAATASYAIINSLNITQDQINHLPRTLPNQNYNYNKTNTKEQYLIKQTKPSHQLQSTYKTLT